MCVGPKLRLRHRHVDVPVDNIVKGKKKSNKLVKRQPISKPQLCDSIEMGQVVLCKMRGHSAWPAKVIGFVNDRVTVEFYGDHTYIDSSRANIYSFEGSSDLLLANLRTKKTELYRKSVREAEIALSVPLEYSIVNQI